MENKNNINGIYKSFYLIALLFILIQVISLYFSMIMLAFLMFTLFLVYDVSTDIKQFHGWTNRKPTHYMLLLVNMIAPIYWVTGLGRGVGEIQFIGDANNIFLILIIVSLSVLVLYTVYLLWIYPKEFRSVYRTFKIHRNTFLYPKTVEAKSIIRSIKKMGIETNIKNNIKAKKVRSMFYRQEYQLIFISSLQAVIDIRPERIYVKFPKVGKNEKELMRTLGELK